MLVVPLPPYPADYETVRGLVIRRSRGPQALPVISRKPFLTVHGNIVYDLYYQSNVDTPYLEKELYQHTLQTSLEITIRDQYPLRVAFTTQRGNSALFRDITGLNLQYSNRDFKNALLLKAQKWEPGTLEEWGELAQLKQRIEERIKELNRLKRWKTSPSQIQMLVEARERELYGRLKDSLSARGSLMDSLQKYMPARDKADSVSDLLRERYAAAARQVDSLQQELVAWERLYQQKQQAFGARKQQLMTAIMNSRNNKELADSLATMNLPDTILPDGYRSLLAVRSVGIGRTMVDYSELTARNVTITGVQAEYNPSYYIAFATGAVDYRFRDFIVNENRVRQYLNIVRVGTGMKEGNNIILSFYTGKKQVYNFNTAPGNNITEAPDYKIMGVSLEGRWQLNKHNYIIGEAAKSSMPYYVRSAHDQGLGASMVSLNDHSNEAFAVTACSFIPATGTRISAMFKRMGANFQSFNLYTSGSAQTAWMVKADQPLFKQQLTLSGAVRQNVYTSVFENAAYRSNTIFKSIQATFRRKHWPVLSLGYFPSSQLMKLSEDKYVENLFYTLVATASHFYRYQGITMNTIFSGTKFYNHQTDSNFVYFNSTNLLLNQTVFLGKFTLNGGLSSAVNQDYALYGIDGSMQYKILTWLEIGGGIKYNYQTEYNLQQTGYSANARVNIPKIGEVALMADKGFVPGVDRQLVPNKTGRITYTKIF
ncbi:hypothetical protein LX66_2951 [Chitinophaga japonensis]|uniref:Uncharacterized protein n=1 Tax=Chitinophaga japonensis TaxID=104662 RepID=A0A562T6I4_CHIJA|nr:hypothetical protein LX66_2951 [Chitinophaga japonensis]